MRVDVIGLGGAGCNILAEVEKKLQGSGVNFHYANTDKVALDRIQTQSEKILLGERLCKGNGCGADYNLGKKVLQEDIEKFSFVEGSDIVFVISGFSKGTGSAASQLAQYFKEKGVLNLFFAIKPFSFEGLKKMQIANQLIKELSQYADSFVVIENSKYQKGTFQQAIQSVNEVISSAISIILKIITSPLLINIDYNDFKAVVKEGKRCIFAYGKADGVGREKKVSEQLLRESMKRVKTCLIFVQGGEDMLVDEVEFIANSINRAISPEAFPIFGADIQQGKSHIEAVLLGVSKEYEITD